MSAPAPSSVGDRVAAIQQRLETACRTNGRDPSEVTLVAASKTQPVEALLEAAAAGIRVFGENRVQEAVAKAPSLPATTSWHLLGPLQSNKVKAALGVCDTLEALDRPAILFEVERRAAALGRRVNAFLEVNLGGEVSKHGLLPDEVLALDLSGFLSIDFVGLMAIPPPEQDPLRTRAWFRALATLRDRVARGNWPGFRGWLSMGMSDDFELAIAEGATHVRVGTALFGPRRKP